MNDRGDEVSKEVMRTLSYERFWFSWMEVLIPRQPTYLA